MDVIRKSTLIGIISLAILLSGIGHWLVGASLYSISFPLVAGALFYLMIMVFAIRRNSARRGGK